VLFTLAVVVVITSLVVIVVVPLFVSLLVVVVVASLCDGVVVALFVVVVVVVPPLIDVVVACGPPLAVVVVVVVGDVDLVEAGGREAAPLHVTSATGQVVFSGGFFSVVGAAHQIWPVTSSQKKNLPSDKQTNSQSKQQFHLQQSNLDEI
jgi:hypothetical protein